MLDAFFFFRALADDSDKRARPYQAMAGYLRCRLGYTASWRHARSVRIRLVDLLSSMEQPGLHDSESGPLFNAVLHADAYGLDTQ